MLKKAAVSLTTLAMGAALAACGQSEDKAVATDDIDAPVIPEPQPTPPQEVAAPKAVQPTDNLWSSAPLSVRTTVANLRIDPDRRNQFIVATTLRFENSSDRSIALALPDYDLNLSLDNGVTTRSNYHGDVSVFKECRATLDDCLAKSRDRFVDIDPGSSLDVNVSFHGNFDDATLSELKSVSKGVMNFSLYLLDPGLSNRTLNISLSNVPLTNRLQ